MPLDNTISTPLFQQLANTLRTAIETGEYPAGSRLPTENELCQKYSVSRVTVRKALDYAQGEKDGLIMRSCTLVDSEEDFTDDAFVQCLSFNVRI